MAINRSRYDAFREDLAALVERLPADELARTIRAKLIDYIRRQEPTAADLVRLEEIFDELLGEDFSGDVGAVEAANAFDLGKYRQATVASIADKVRRSIILQEDVEELIERIRPINQKTEFYARAIGQTIIKRYGRALKNEKARLAEVERFQYVGAIRRTSREFCRTHAGKTYALTTILQLKNRNLEPVIENCGGWNCVHDWEPDPFATAEDEDDVPTAAEA